MKKIILSLIILSFIAPSISFAHPGRTDSSGGHTCRTNCANWGLSTGEYHYHKSKGVSQAKEPIKSTYGAQGTGYTTPAPEYKIPASSVKTPVINTPVVTKPTIDTSLTPPIQKEKKSWLSRVFSWVF